MAKVKEMIEKITDQEGKREKAKKEVTQLVMLANAKLDAMEARLRDMFRNKELESQMEIVGDRMGAFSREYRVNYVDGSLSNAVNDLVDSIMSIGSESAKANITKTIKNALNAMFASVEATEEEKRIFVVLLEGAALVRYDFDIWKSAEADSAIFEHCHSVVAITYARSVVDHTKITEDELNDAIGRYLGGEANLDDVIAYKKKLIELLNIHANENNSEIRLCSAPDNELLPLMAHIPVDINKAKDFAENSKMTEESKYVAELLRTQDLKEGETV